MGVGEKYAASGISTVIFTVTVFLIPSVLFFLSAGCSERGLACETGSISLVSDCCLYFCLHAVFVLAK